jgi:hypothetical protein
MALMKKYYYKGLGLEFKGKGLYEKPVASDQPSWDGVSDLTNLDLSYAARIVAEGEWANRGSRPRTLAHQTDRAFYMWTGSEESLFVLS